MGTVFNLMCPGENGKYHRLIMTKDGTEGRGLSYDDYCTHNTEAAEKRNQIKIAYNNLPPFLNVLSHNSKMEEYSLFWTLENSRQNPYVSKDWEILKLFFDKGRVQ